MGVCVLQRTRERNVSDRRVALLVAECSKCANTATFAKPYRQNTYFKGKLAESSSKECLLVVHDPGRLENGERWLEEVSSRVDLVRRCADHGAVR
jgi:hypothetical protein